MSLEHVGSERNDEEVVKEALSQDASAFQFIGEQLRSSSGFLWDVLLRFGLSDDFAAEPECDIQDDFPSLACRKMR